MLPSMRRAFGPVVVLALLAGLPQAGLATPHASPAAVRSCGGIGPAGPGEITNITATSVSCVKARRIAKGVHIRACGLPAGCGTRERFRAMGYTCRSGPIVDYEQETRCTRGKRLVRFGVIFD